MNAVPEPGSIALVSVTVAGRRQAEVLAAAWPHAHRVDAGSVAESLRRAWRDHDAVVAFVATGVVVRVLGPLLADKHAEPAVVVADDAGRHAIALLGGHAAAANALAADVAALLDGSAVVTPATDVHGIPGLDTLGLPVEGAVPAVTRAILDGLPVRWEVDPAWPRRAVPAPALPPSVRPDAAGPLRILVTDRAGLPDAYTVVLRPPTLVVGVGASRGATAAEVLDLIGTALAGAGLGPTAVRCLASADVKADEPGIVAAARALGVPLVTYPASALAAVPVPNPSEVVRAAVGTPSVSEAAALLAPTPTHPRRDHGVRRDHGLQMSDDPSTEVHDHGRVHDHTEVHDHGGGGWGTSSWGRWWRRGWPGRPGWRGWRGGSRSRWRGTLRAGGWRSSGSGRARVT